MLGAERESAKGGVWAKWDETSGPEEGGAFHHGCCLGDSGEQGLWRESEKNLESEERWATESSLSIRPGFTGIRGKPGERKRRREVSVVRGRKGQVLETFKRIPCSPKFSYIFPFLFLVAKLGGAPGLAGREEGLCRGMRYQGSTGRDFKVTQTRFPPNSPRVQYYLQDGGVRYSARFVNGRKKAPNSANPKANFA